MMAGFGHLDGFLERGLTFGSGDDDLNLGAVKIMLTMTTGAMRPPIDELQAIVLRAHDAGFQVAVHAVEAEAVEAAVDALIKAQSQSPRAYRDRIEHCSECPPEVLRKLEGAGILVVTQPGFLYYSGKRYLSEVPEDAQAWLYRLRSLLDAGVKLAASSDAPVIEPDPLIGIYAAVSRRAVSGETIGGSEGISALEALKMYTLGGAYASFQEADKGSIEVGKLADLTLLDQDLTSVETEQIPQTRVTMTIIGGRVVWQVS
ncbi:MAG: amidohydrolase family protein, partial [Chloroflexi bacterium]|nr:amidohydrolase family protein [Chloroflexota bacterium]